MAKILLVANTTWSMVKFRYGLMKGLVANGYEVYVLAPHDSFVADITAIGCHHIDLKLDNSGANIYSDLSLIKHMFKIYKHIQPDIIFHYTIKPNIYGSIAAHYAKIPSIAVITGLGYTFLNHTLKAITARILYRISLQYATQAWFINQDDLTHFIESKIINNKKTLLLSGEGVDIEKFHVYPKKHKRESFVFILIARLLWDKGVGEYVQAAKKLKTLHGDKVTCRIVGFTDCDNPQAITMNQIQAWDKEGYIEYSEAVEDVREVLCDIDCMVLPSYREGVSMILMEAASMQKPIIATNVPGCKELVIEGESGYLCEARSHVDLYAKMEKMYLTDEQTRHKMGVKAREHMCQNFDETLIINTYLRALEMFNT